MNRKRRQKSILHIIRMTCYGKYFLFFIVARIFSLFGLHFSLKMPNKLCLQINLYFFLSFRAYWSTYRQILDLQSLIKVLLQSQFRKLTSRQLSFNFQCFSSSHQIFELFSKTCNVFISVFCASFYRGNWRRLSWEWCGGRKSYENTLCNMVKRWAHFWWKTIFISHANVSLFSSTFAATKSKSFLKMHNHNKRWKKSQIGATNDLFF